MKYKEKGTETLIEIRGEGGFVITAPSSGKVNPAGDYKLIKGGLSSIPKISRADRKKIFRVAKTFNIPKVKQERQEHKSQPETALELVDDLRVFHDEKMDSYCYLKGNCYRIRSTEIRMYISHIYYRATGKTINSNSLNEVLSALEGKARFEGKMHKLSVRVASKGEYIYYDLGNGRAVKTGVDGWRIVKAPPLFRRFNHQKSQVDPVAGGNPMKLFDFINIPKKHHLETLVTVISYLVAGIAHPIFHTHGPKGSAKSTSCDILKLIIDPSSLDRISSTTDRAEVIRQFSKHYMPVFDNVSKISSDFSDLLCMASTGGGMSKRTLYTDDDDHIYNFMICCVINGINLLVTKPDLLDRTILLHLARIKAADRKEENSHMLEFKAALPEILGGMFDVLSKAMAKYPKVSLDKLPRMADFAKWGYAIAEALGKGKGKQFLLDYQENIKRQNSEVLHNNSLCLSVTRLMDSHNEWKGTVKKAYDELRSIADPSKNDKTFPPDSKNLRRYLASIQSTLIESENITYKFLEKRKSDGYHVIFIKNLEEDN